MELIVNDLFRACTHIKHAIKSAPEPKPSWILTLGNTYRQIYRSNHNKKYQSKAIRCYVNCVQAAKASDEPKVSSKEDYIKSRNKSDSEFHSDSEYQSKLSEGYALCYLRLWLMAYEVFTTINNTPKTAYCLGMINSIIAKRDKDDGDSRGCKMFNDKSADNFKEAASRAPKDSMYYNLWSIALGRTKDYRDAVAVSHIAIAFNDRNPKYYYDLAWQERGLDNSKECVQAIKKAMTLDPDNAKYKRYWKKLRTYHVVYSPTFDYSAQLNRMIGLGSVKRAISTLVSQADLAKIRSGSPKHQEIHLAFEGNPGTGKTTVASLLCGILYQKHVISKYKFVRVNATKLTGRYYGQASRNVRRLIHKALGGVLFIDEAYHLAHRNKGGSHSDFEDEAVEELIPDIEHYRNDLVVVVAGYTNRMEHFLNDSNPGLSSRFPQRERIIFPDYSAKECSQIFRLYLRKHHFTIHSRTARSLMNTFIYHYVKYHSKIGDFANARSMRNIYTGLIDAYSIRMTNKYSHDQLIRLRNTHSRTLNNITIGDVKSAINYK